MKLRGQGRGLVGGKCAEQKPRALEARWSFLEVEHSGDIAMGDGDTVGVQGGSTKPVIWSVEVGHMLTHRERAVRHDSKRWGRRHGGLAWRDAMDRVESVCGDFQVTIARGLVWCTRVMS